MSTKRYPRMARVNEVVHEALADELERLTDPRLELVTITGVVVSPDLRDATVYYSALSAPSGAEAAGAGLSAAGSKLRAGLGRQVRLKYLPRLRFRQDHGISEGQRMEEILRGLGDEGAKGDEPRGGTS